MQNFTKLTLALLVATPGLYSCSTTKQDVNDEWKEVSEERQDAEKTTRRYAAEEKERFEMQASKKVDRYELKLTELRTEMVQAAGARKYGLQDAIWEGERKISEAKKDLEALKKKDAQSWEADRDNINRKFAQIEDVLAGSNVAE